MSLMSETAASEATCLMGLDTVRFKTPSMALQLVRLIEAKGTHYQCTDNATGIKIGDIVSVTVTDNDEYDLFATPAQA